MIKAYPLFLLGFLLSGCHTIKLHVSDYSYNHPKYKDWYTSSLRPDEKVVNTWYHYITSFTPDKKYIVRTFFPETKQITSLTTYENDNYASRKNGWCKTWFDNGARDSEGFYINGKQEGKWSYFHFESDTLASNGMYVTGEKSGVWKGYDSKGRIRSEITYINNIKEGKFIFYDSLSNVTNTGLYKADTIYEQSSVTDVFSKQDEMPYMLASKDIVDKKERMEHSQTFFLQSIYKNIRYPGLARELGVEGSALVRFYVDVDGQVKDVTVLKGICQSIAEESKRVAEALPPWVPGMQAGKPVKVYFNLPISFNLE